MSSTYIKELWGIILAGGDGIRLQDFLLKEFGFTKPKQFCSIIGTRSLYKHTLDRVSTLIPIGQILTVITDKHYEYIQEEFEDPLIEQIIIQPCNRETGPGVILPLLKLYQNSPDAIVCIFPSDHFILEEIEFMDHIREAVEFILANQNKILLLGVKPYNVTNSYGIIVPGQKISHDGIRTIFRVNKFFEKPNINYSDDFSSNQYLWNTMVIAGKCKTFIDIISKSLPEIYRLFNPFIRVLGLNYEKEVINTLYSNLPKINFSKNILENITEHLYVMEMENIYWSDWGEEEKIISTLDILGIHDTKNILVG